ncbi:MAG: tRNA (N6-isopentenyl adenosine(37)-C2)-methylthiotransferase MiaB [Nitrospirae bacterium]|nr:tRNA (N6-isopentenyl adenosine(37)-C2)-methylthiotransferase MiaB [Nitrospirota bacterium]MBF0535038.1 tRNA (N6-isopentenyl adenosine(37)-C2)-methylthiotransferase MiaB [Nitrospirota bacterium]MBF0616546.1 tRNA (N6-isopentenyl adenosine(37)-C2)-methylthiotransferase MiaB [Nitrospirota bacterium]
MTRDKLTAYIHTWGCQMNVRDSEHIKGILKGEGYDISDTPEGASLVVLNTCSIREKAEQKFLSELGRLSLQKKKHPELKIAVSGCIAQQQGRALLKSHPSVDFSFGPQNIFGLKEFLYDENRTAFTKENYEAEDEKLQTPHRDNDLRAWVNIMYGCNNYCSYCVVPYTRGRERSRPFEHIITEIRDLAGIGYKEITLLGQNVNSYNGGCTFPELLTMISNIEGILRIRFITSHPKDLTVQLASTIGETKKICNHIHLPVQSGSSSVLARMNRKYTYEEYFCKIQLLRKHVPDIAITTDIIAGFPGETDSDHKETVRALKEIEFDGIFAFKYSQRPNTKATGMEHQLSDSIKSQRLAEILTVSDTITERINKSLEGRCFEVMTEGKNETNSENKWFGRTTSNKIVSFLPGENTERGRVVMVKIIEGFKHSLEGELVV